LPLAGSYALAGNSQQNGRPARVAGRKIRLETHRCAQQQYGRRWLRGIVFDFSQKHIGIEGIELQGTFQRELRRITAILDCQSAPILKSFGNVK